MVSDLFSPDLIFKSNLGRGKRKTLGLRFDMDKSKFKKKKSLWSELDIGQILNVKGWKLGAKKGFNIFRSWCYMV